MIHKTKGGKLHACWQSSMAGIKEASTGAQEVVVEGKIASNFASNQAQRQQDNNTEYGTEHGQQGSREGRLQGVSYPCHCSSPCLRRRAQGARNGCSHISSPQVRSPSPDVDIQIRDLPSSEEAQHHDARVGS